ncbi:MAG TPA: NAD(P)/FAD-dependent oxidoreductase [Candidatus Cybelea sp.]|nr:NAD(P)/FAD-dependent oxidoreductase [Candidatus Cybelea sp.]
MKEFDLLVVGTGSSGTSVAEACAKAQLRVAIVDERAYGGTCALRGCDPKKILISAAALIDWSQRMHGKGIGGEIRIDWPQLMQFKRTFTEPVPPERERNLRDAGVATYHGTARFVDATTVAISNEPVKARHVVLATGAHPAPLGLAGEEHLITSEDFLDLDALPRRIAFIGGGYIAFELAHLAARAGATCVILQRGPRVLTGFDASLVDRIVQIGTNVGIDVRVNVEVRSIEQTRDGVRVSGTSAGKDFALEYDAAVHAAGRVADLDRIDLDTGHVARTKKGVAVNEFFQSCTNAGVYAVGDCADGGGLPLTPTASAEGDLVARNLIEGNRFSLDFSGLASIVYTIPPLGMTGLTEDRAREAGVQFAIHESDTTKWYSSRSVGARGSQYRLLVEERSGRIVGAHVLGPQTEELINVFSLAIRAKIPASVLKSVLFAYPTASSDIEPMFA